MTRLLSTKARTGARSKLAEASSSSSTTNPQTATAATPQKFLSKSTKPTLRSASSVTKIFWKTPQFVALQSLVIVASLFLGFSLGVIVGHSACTSSCNNNNNILNSPASLLGSNNDDCQAKLKAKDQEIAKHRVNRFSNNVKDFAVGMGMVLRDEFNTRFDSGVPVENSTNTNDRVLLLYNDKESLPSDEILYKAVQEEGGGLPHLGVFRAVKNCDYLNVVLLQAKQPKSCTALVGQYGSYHVQKWMRLPDAKDGHGNFGALDTAAPLRLMNRAAHPSGRKSIQVPTATETKRFFNIVKTYLSNLDTMLEKVKPIAAKIARDNTIVVMVCNQGMSELLANFVCSSKARGLDVSNVLVFATDAETVNIATDLGLAVFHNEMMFGNLPNQAADYYGDDKFSSMMLAKVYCVHMISQLGYDLLFQDVDIVWYKNPLAYFKERKSDGFDMYFQDDGSRSVHYRPYSANSGFYYVRQSDMTRYFFTNFLLSAATVITTRSHQQTMIFVLAEFASNFGLKPKVISRDALEFPGGYTFHESNSISRMKNILAGKGGNLIFHMSWTDNKEIKTKFFQQMGEWWVNEDNQSCRAEAKFACHFKDKPSKQPCPNSPTIDANGKSFW